MTRTDPQPKVRGLVDRDSFLKLEPAAQETLLRQTLLLYLTALELTNRNPDEWEAAAFIAATDHLTARATLRAYDDAERMLLPADQRPRARPSAARMTSVLRVQAGEAGIATLPPREKLDRNALRRHLLQLSAIQLPPERTTAADAARDMPARSRRRAMQAAGNAEGDEAGD